MSCLLIGSTAKVAAITCNAHNDPTFYTFTDVVQSQTSIFADGADTTILSACHKSACGTQYSCISKTDISALAYGKLEALQEKDRDGRSQVSLRQNTRQQKR